MNKTTRLAVLAVAVASCAGWLTACETLIVADEGYNEAAEAVTRARVVAELREAQRLGLINVGEEGFSHETDEQRRMIARAGEAAAVAATGTEARQPK